MSGQLATSKIRHEHLERCVYIYVRQSTLIQVRENTTSTLRQYDLTKLAAELGWDEEKIIVVDQDQARSGASTENRDGFKRMLSEIALGNVGAVMSLEASRLARDSSAWHQLLKICSITHTLIVDEIGIYDPCDRDDRLLLGFKGTMSEAELSLIVSRMMGAKRRKAEDGTLRFPLPVGFIYNDNGQIILDPNEEIQHIIRLLFDTFDRCSSVRMLVREFNEKGLLFPSQSFERGCGGEIKWVPLRYPRALWVIKHPMYAGTYAYGRTRSYTHIDLELSTEVTKRIRSVDIRDWDVLRLNNHEGYLTWEKYIHNQERVVNNRNRRSENRPGAVRAGAALLQGLIVCGMCGRRVQVRYPKGREHPIYLCRGANIEFADPAVCLQFSGKLIDKAVADTFLEAVKPAHLQLSINTIERLEADMRQVHRQWELRIENARYEADLARRRFAAVDPENRLVARNLEREWNERLVEVERLEREMKIATTGSLETLTQPERQSILNLARDLPKVWHAETTTQVERKQLLRCLVKDVTVVREGRNVHLSIRWQTDACTRLDVILSSIADLHKTDPATLAMIKELAPEHSNQQIADRLNQAGIRSKRGLKFNKNLVQSLCHQHNLPRARQVHPSENPPEGRCSVPTAAQMLNVSVDTILKWCKRKRLDAIQSKPDSYWWINLPPEKIAELKKAKA